MTKEKIVETLLEKKMTIGSIESFTGGLFASTITSVPGASKVFPGSIVTYANEVKMKLVGVSAKNIAIHGVVSKEVAKEMAEKGREVLGVDMCVSFTGNAGPTALDHLPVGRCFVAISTKYLTTTFELQISSADRDAIREKAVETALTKVWNRLQVSREEEEKLVSLHN